MFDGLLSGNGDSLDVATIDTSPFVLIKHTKRDGVCFRGRSANGNTIIFDYKNYRQLALFGKTNGFKKITLPSRCLTERCVDDTHFIIELHTPSCTTGRKQVCTDGGWMTPNIERAIAKMPSKLATTTRGVTLGVKSQRHIVIRQAALKAKSSVAIIGKCIIFWLHVECQSGKRFVPHS